MKALLLEGAPEDIIAVLTSEAMRASGFTGTVGDGVAETQSTPVQDDGQRYVGISFAVNMLQRRPLSKEQLIVLRTLYAAHPKLVSAIALRKELKFQRRQFSGLMGAFGNRLTHTPGWKTDHWFFRQEWNNDEECYHYGLPDSVRTALEKIQLV